MSSQGKKSLTNTFTAAHNFRQTSRDSYGDDDGSDDDGHSGWSDEKEEEEAAAAASEEEVAMNGEDSLDLKEQLKQSMLKQQQLEAQLKLAADNGFEFTIVEKDGEVEGDSCFRLVVVSVKASFVCLLSCLS